ncbi:MAG TPA: glyoxylate/hydroxypyruvate reductase A [Hyphomicrobiaceae bacterium]|nr:glyoxylate/hydroxypyruvate reductase A [Hyphomicrobiaceae bacterium]
MALLIIGSQRAGEFARVLGELRPGADLRLWPNAGNLSEITHALAWGPPPGALAQLPNLKLIVSVGAGVDHLFKDPDLPKGVPIVRYVDPDLTRRMVQYVTLHVLWHHRRMCEFQEQQRARVWKYLPEPSPGDVRVGLMGLGVMGAAAVPPLSTLGFKLRGWSRNERHIAGVECFAGDKGFAPFLAETDILVCTLPLTPDTRGVIGKRLLDGLSINGRHARMPGPAIINAGRGGLQVEGDIMAALASGRLYAASLDVFETEPLPTSSPLWENPRVVITPHNAAESEPYSIVRYFLRQADAEASGHPLENIVDPKRQY